MDKVMPYLAHLILAISRSSICSETSWDIARMASQFTSGQDPLQCYPGLS